MDPALSHAAVNPGLCPQNPDSGICYPDVNPGVPPNVMEMGPAPDFGHVGENPEGNRPISEPGDVRQRSAPALGSPAAALGIKK